MAEVDQPSSGIIIMSQATTICLYHYTQPAVPLVDTLTLPPGEAVGLFYGARWCRLGRLRSGAIEFTDGASLDPELIFEARVFNAAGELRWLRDPQGDGKGQAVYLTETAMPDSVFEEYQGQGWEKHQPDNDRAEAWSQISVQDQAYLLWGERWQPKVPLPEGWSLLATARIGELPIPLNLSDKGKGAKLKVREYLGPAPDPVARRHGNIVVIEERLVGLEEWV